MSGMTGAIMTLSLFRFLEDCEGRSHTVGANEGMTTVRKDHGFCLKSTNCLSRMVRNEVVPHLACAFRNSSVYCSGQITSPSILGFTKALPGSPLFCLLRSLPY
jgi:hypothetical protein